MDYTKFKIVEFGERTIAKVNGFIAVLDTWYDAADTLTFHKNNIQQFAEPFDFVKYQVTDDVLVSNVAVITINFPPNKITDPQSEDVNTEILNDTQYVVSENIPYNNAVDRIKILSFDNAVGSLTFNGSNIYPGFEILQYDFSLLKFNSKKGTGIPYQQITYQVGNAGGYNPTIYTLQYNIGGLATIDLISQETLNEDGITTMSFDVKINNGRVNGIAKVNVAVNLSSSAWPVDTENFFNLSYNDDDIENNVNFNEDFDVDLNGEGFENLFSLLNVNNADFPITGTITLTLLEVNGNSGLVNIGAAQIIINVSL